jgi:sec-independent protein translocase protein TatA
MFEGLLQPMHLLLIFGIPFIVMGPKKLPELGRGLGEGIRGLKDALAGSHGEKKDEDDVKRLA